jgi:diaminohydroxyphosphoribosylaminopyrimidine deaminase/5-amino-6-(5-phosphoribosylamino)uracil reductase
MQIQSSPVDELMMSRALELAEASVGMASPNPQVGCVLARGAEILGSGAHFYDLYDHAEIAALKDAAAAGHDVRGATAYVTLEPCSHHGRTGPCADALIAAGIARCVVATGDPNPAVNGRGIDRMRAAGIQVDLGLMVERARRLNDAFAMSMTRHRPFVTLKAALSVDGYLAPPPSRRGPEAAPFWLTGSEARGEVQRLRHTSDAILTGIGTVLADDPLLTDRTGLPRRRPLLRVLLDSRLRLPLRAKLVQTAQKNGAEDLWIFCGTDAPMERQAALEELGAKVVHVGAAAGLDLAEVLAHLHAAGMLSLLVEGGSAVNGVFLSSDLVDRAVLFYAQTELGADAVPFAAGSAGPFALEERFISMRKQMFGADVCVSGLLRDPWLGWGDKGFF